MKKHVLTKRHDEGIYYLFMNLNRQLSFMAYFRWPNYETRNQLDLINGIVARINSEVLRKIGHRTCAVKTEMNAIIPHHNLKSLRLSVSITDKGSLGNPHYDGS